MIQKKRAVVIGGAGFIGSYVVKELLNQQYDVLIIDNMSTGKKENVPHEASLALEDIRNYESLLTHIQEGDIIFLLAALVSVPISLEKPHEGHENNIRGMYNVFEVARVKHAFGVIFSSSAAVYGNKEGIVTEQDSISPETPYGLHKAIGEQMAKLYTECFNLPTVCLRYFNVYGKGHHEEGSYAPVIAKFLKLSKEQKPLTVTGDGSQTRDFVHVEDVARANILAIPLLSETKNYCFNICTGESFSIKKIAETIGGTIVYTEKRMEINSSLGDNTQAKNILAWAPSKKLQEGIRELL